MTVKEELEKFSHEVEEVLHEVEEVLRDVKDNVILSVRDFSLQIAFVLMGITATILIVGTVYVWCFHHPKHARTEGDKSQKQTRSKISKKSDKEKSELKDSENVEETPEPALDQSEEEIEEIATAVGKVAEEETFVTSHEADQVKKVAEDNVGQSDQNGHVRKRTTASSVNNNNSPQKSKIPVFNRQRSKNS